MVTCWERADLLAFLCVMFNCDFVTFPCGVLGQVCCLIVSISDLCLPLKLSVSRTFISTILLKKNVNSTSPDSLVVKASASGAEGRSFES